MIFHRENGHNGKVPLIEYLFNNIYIKGNSFIMEYIIKGCKIVQKK